jgi:taurine dioxygenase
MSRATAVAAHAVAARETPLHPSVGMRLEGFDVGRGLDAAAWSEIERAFLEHHVIALPAQNLTMEQFLDFSRRFGALESHVLREFLNPEHKEVLMLSNEVEDGKAVGLADAGTYWHSDLSYKAQPSRTTILYGITIPDEGGDTLFINMVRAYDDLSDDIKCRIAGLKAEHNYAYRSNKLARELGNRKELTPEQLRETPTVVHPVVRTHPSTGRKALYINPGFTVRLLGLPEDEARELMQELFDHCTQPKYILRYKWRKGDLVLWDNAATMHHATTRDLDPAKHRTLWRTIVSGDEPY